MAIRKIITKENSMLRKKSRAVTEFDDRLSTLIDDMIDTMYKAEGVGTMTVYRKTISRFDSAYAAEIYSRFQKYHQVNSIN